ncbi:MAG TPA: HAD family hydrolase [Rhodothermales bacterium]|nr:HAD family hydrolase [Rhodothermales bacterium]
MLLLFDIDGTLLQSHGVGRRAVEHSLSARFGRPIDTSSVTFSGKTDPQIFREILSDPSIAGDLPDDLDVAVRQACEAYARRMHETWDEATVEALPGAVELVRALHADGEPLGLLTGNLEPMAYLKVNRIGLGREFPLGAFGSDHEDRNQLPLVALERARQLGALDLAAEHLVLIGDTPRDVQAAQAVGAKSVAVATGRFSAEELEASRPTVLLETLEAFDLASVA